MTTSLASVPYTGWNWLARSIFAVTLVSWRVQGAEHVPRQGPLIVVSNHMSWIDPILLGLAFPRRIWWVAKPQLYRHPLIYPVMRTYGSIKVERGKAQRATFDAVLRTLAAGKVVGMFPEGRRSQRGLAQGKRGTALLASQAGVPLIPVGITGSERVRGWRTYFSRPKLSVTIGTPFTLPPVHEAFIRSDLAARSDLIMRRIADLLPLAYRGVYGEENQ